MTGLTNDNPEQFKTILPVNDSDRPFIEKLKLGNLMKNSQSKSEYSAFLQFAIKLIPYLESNNEIESSLIGLTEQQDSYIRRLALNQISNRIDALEDAIRARDDFASKFEERMKEQSAQLSKSLNFTNQSVAGCQANQLNMSKKIDNIIPAVHKLLDTWRSDLDKMDANIVDIIKTEKNNSQTYNNLKV